jgi:regulator of protease activity HflC (stomatin/prohibitin superfamily)
VKSENDKLSAVDYATAAETVADGEKRASIKKAEGIRQARILQAEGEAEAIRLVNEAANKYFIGNAQLLKRLEVVQNSLEDNAKIVIPSNTDLVNVIGDLAGVLPIKKRSEHN